MKARNSFTMCIRIFLISKKDDCVFTKSTFKTYFGIYGLLYLCLILVNYIVEKDETDTGGKGQRKDSAEDNEDEETP